MVVQSKAIAGKTKMNRAAIDPMHEMATLMLGTAQAISRVVQNHASDKTMRLVNRPLELVGLSDGGKRSSRADLEKGDSVKFLSSSLNLWTPIMLKSNNVIFFHLFCTALPHGLTFRKT